MSKWDRINLSSIQQPCCIRAVQQEPGIAAASALVVCLSCNTKLIFDGRWKVARDFARVSPSSGSI
jgi:hypothetical protein